MKPILTSFIALLSLVGSTQTDNSLLWRISGNGLAEYSYLFGTIHLQDKRVHQLPDSIAPTLNSCKALALELISAEQNVMEIMKAMTLDSTTLDQLLSAEDYQKLLTHFQGKEDLKLMTLMLNKFKPIYVSMLMMMSEVTKDVPMAVDQRLEFLAKAQEKKLISIETLDEQMAALDDIPMKEQIEALLEQLNDPKKNKALMEEMIQLYIRQDMKQLSVLMKEQDMSESFNAALLEKRNQVMADRIEKMIQEQSTFIGIGTAHLPEDQGVIALLQQKGFTVLPVISEYTGKFEEELKVNGQ